MKIPAGRNGNPNLIIFLIDFDCTCNKDILLIMTGRDKIKFTLSDGVNSSDEKTIYITVK